MAQKTCHWEPCPGTLPEAEMPLPSSVVSLLHGAAEPWAQRHPRHPKGPIVDPKRELKRSPTGIPRRASIESPGTSSSDLEQIAETAAAPTPSQRKVRRRRKGNERIPRQLELSVDNR